MTEPMYYVSLGDEAPVDCPPPAPVPLQLRDEPVIRAVQFEAPEVATSGPAAFAPEMQWEPRTQPEMPTSEFEPVAAVTQARSIEAVPDVSMAAPADSFEHLMARLSRSRDVMRDAQVYCNGIADEIAATVESFGIAAAHLRSVGREQGELQTLMDAAITNLHHINDHFEAQHVSAATEAAGMIERAAAEADSLRASAMADVERTRERLVRFTAEIGSVATELRGGGVARAS